MAMPRKGRRSITVDATKYHYLVAVERSERVVIQLAEDSGNCLFVFPFAIMKPSHIADAIRFALSCGWQPMSKSDDCWLAFDAAADGGSLFEHIPNDDFRVVTYPNHGRIPENMNTARFKDLRPWYLRPMPTTRQE